MIIKPDELVPIGATITPMYKAIRRVVLDLPDDFNNALAEEVLDLSVHDMVSPQNLMYKSMYEFNLDTPEGINRLLSLLPVLDPEIIKTTTQEIWPAAPVADLEFDANMARAEVRGYLLDLLEDHGEQAGQEGQEGDEPTGEPSPPVSPEPPAG